MEDLVQIARPSSNKPVWFFLFINHEVSSLKVSLSRHLSMLEFGFIFTS